MLTDSEVDRLISRFQIHVCEEDYQLFADSQPVREFTDEQIRLFTCVGCRVNTLEIYEYYMVQFHIWETVVPEHQQREVLCIGCLEDCMGRQLVTADFTEAPINYRGPRSERLLSRLGDWFTAPLYDPAKESLMDAAKRLAEERGW